MLLIKLIFFRECINKVCEAAGLKTADKKRKVSSIIFFLNEVYYLSCSLILK